MITDAVIIIVLLIILRTLNQWEFNEIEKKYFVENLNIGDIFFHPDNETRLLKITFIDIKNKEIYFDSNQGDTKIQLKIDDLFYCDYVKK
ncbi:MAG: hypothetical protein ACOCVF_03445 [bacterium]